MDESAYGQIITTGIASVHTLFNVINVFIFIPLVGVLAKIVTKLVPEKETREVQHLTYLDVRMLDTPSLGIVQSSGQINFMGESVSKMMDKLEEILSSEASQPEIERKLFHREEILDNVQKEIFLFLSHIVSGQVPQEVSDCAQMQMRIADEYESLSDYITNVLKGIKKLEQNGLKLDRLAREDLQCLHASVASYIEKINSYVKENNKDTLSWANSDGAAITKQMKAFRRQHIERLQKEELSPYFSLVFTDMLNYYRRMKDHALNIAEVVAGEK